MSFPRRLPIGIQSFKVLRTDHYLYVDKTDYLFRLVQGGRVYFFSRLRRFGKSFFLSTLAAYFLGQKELFKDLSIEKAEEEHAVQEKRTAVFVRCVIIHCDGISLVVFLLNLFCLTGSA